MYIFELSNIPGIKILPIEVRKVDTINDNTIAMVVDPYGMPCISPSGVLKFYMPVAGYKPKVIEEIGIK